MSPRLIALTVACLLTVCPALRADPLCTDPSDPNYVDNCGQLPPVSTLAYPETPPPPPAQRADGKVCSYTLQSYDRSTGEAVYTENCTGGVGGGDISKLWTNERPSPEEIEAYRNRQRRRALGLE